MNNINPVFSDVLLQFRENIKQIMLPYNETMQRFSELANRVSEAMKPWRDFTVEFLTLILL
jgi:hypothetical protein